MTFNNAINNTNIIIEKTADNFISYLYSNGCFFGYEEGEKIIEIKKEDIINANKISYYNPNLQLAAASVVPEEFERSDVLNEDINTWAVTRLATKYKNGHFNKNGLVSKKNIESLKELYKYEHPNDDIEGAFKALDPEKVYNLIKRANIRIDAKTAFGDPLVFDNYEKLRIEQTNNWKTNNLINGIGFEVIVRAYYRVFKNKLLNFTTGNDSFKDLDGKRDHVQCKVLTSKNNTIKFGSLKKIIEEGSSFSQKITNFVGVARDKTNFSEVFYYDGIAAVKELYNFFCNSGFNKIDLSSENSRKEINEIKNRLKRENAIISKDVKFGDVIKIVSQKVSKAKGKIAVSLYSTYPSLKNSKLSNRLINVTTDFNSIMKANNYVFK